MKKSACTAFILALGTLGASAADMATKGYAVRQTAAYNWTGCYIGGNAGGVWSSATSTVALEAIGPQVAFSKDVGKAASDSFLGGGQIGCNRQVGNWVLGVEGSADWSSWSVSRATSLPILSSAGATDLLQIRSDWQTSARGRLGYSFDRMLVYMTGGVAFTRAKVNTDFFFVDFPTAPTTSFSDSRTLKGATFGGGVEYAVANNWTIGAEARYAWYGKQTYNVGGVAVAQFGAGGRPVFVFSNTTQTARFDTLEVMGRLNWKFN